MKKIIIFAVVSIVIVASVVGSIYILKSINSGSTTQTQTPATKESADNLKTSGVKVLHSNPTSARDSLVKARQQYLDLKDNNGVTDVDALIYQIDHPSK